MSDLYQRTLEKKSYLESLGYTYILKWEWDFDREILENHEIKSFVDNVNYVTPLEPRKSFAGGRAEVFKLYYEAKYGEEINYYDVTSLYPYINKTGKAMLDHPTVVTENFEDISAYEGIIKSKSTPPRKLYIPVFFLQKSTIKYYFRYAGHVPNHNIRLRVFILTSKEQLQAPGSRMY